MMRHRTYVIVVVTDVYRAPTRQRRCHRAAQARKCGRIATHGNESAATVLPGDNVGTVPPHDGQSLVATMHTHYLRATVITLPQRLHAMTTTRAQCPCAAMTTQALAQHHRKTMTTRSQRPCMTATTHAQNPHETTITSAPSPCGPTQRRPRIDDHTHSSPTQRRPRVHRATPP